MILALSSPHFHFLPVFRGHLQFVGMVFKLDASNNKSHNRLLHPARSTKLSIFTVDGLAFFSLKENLLIRCEPCDGLFFLLKKMTN